MADFSEVVRDKHCPFELVKDSAYLMPFTISLHNKIFNSVLCEVFTSQCDTAFPKLMMMLSLAQMIKIQNNYADKLKHIKFKLIEYILFCMYLYFVRDTKFRK